MLLFVGIGCLEWLTMARIVRGQTLSIKQREFIAAERTIGASTSRILFRHILPVVIPTLTTLATLDFAFVMLAESSLSFLGIGIQPPEITWGLMIAQGKQYLTNAWWLSFWPGLAIILTTLSLNLLSFWLRIALDPTPYHSTHDVEDFFDVAAKVGYEVPVARIFFKPAELRSLEEIDADVQAVIADLSEKFKAVKAIEDKPRPPTSTPPPSPRRAPPPVPTTPPV